MEDSQLAEQREREQIEFAHRTAYLSCAYRLQDIGEHEEAEAMLYLARLPKSRKVLVKLIKAIEDGNSD